MIDDETTLPASIGILIIGAGFSGVCCGIKLLAAGRLESSPPPAGESSASSVTLPFPPGDVAVNSARAFRFGNKPGILVRTDTGELRAFSAVCTHLDCNVSWKPGQRPNRTRLWRWTC